MTPEIHHIILIAYINTGAYGALARELNYDSPTTIKDIIQGRKNHIAKERLRKIIDLTIESCIDLKTKV